MSDKLTRRKVLVVEDEPAIRTLLQTLLRELGCEDEIVSSGQEALATLSRNRFDAVLLDLRCSDLKADDVVPQIHRMRSSLVGRVLVITGEVADSKTLDLIESHFLLHIPGNRLGEDLASWLRAILRIAPSPSHH